MGRAQNIHIHRSLEEVDFTLVDGFKGPRLPWRKQLQLWWKQHESEDLKRSLKMGLNCCGLTMNFNEELLLVDKQRQQFLEMEPTPGEDAVEIVEMTEERFRI